MRNIKIRFIYPLMGLALTVACGTFKVRDKNISEVSSIHSAALVGFSVVEPLKKDIAFNLGSGNVEGEQAMARFQEKSAHVDSMFQDLHRSLAIRLKWDVLDLAKMKTNSGYKTAYQKTMKGWQNKMPPGAGHIQFIASDILDYDALRILGQEGRDALIDALKVDAIVVAKVNVELHGTSVMGFGPHHPVSYLSFQIYKRGIEPAVWFDGQVVGKEMPSLGNTALWNQEKLQEYALESAKDAFTKIDQKRD